MVTDFVTCLSFDGTCEAAFKHYEKVFGGETPDADASWHGGSG